MSNKPFIYQAPFPMGKDNTRYYLLTSDYVSVADYDGETILKVEPEALTLLAQRAFHDASFMLRPAHRNRLQLFFTIPEASENDKYVALQFLRNSGNRRQGVLPTCQDTGTAIIVGKKGPSACGPVAVMKHCQASITPISKITCAIHRTRRWTCIKRSTPARPACANRPVRGRWR